MRTLIPLVLVSLVLGQDAPVAAPQSTVSDKQIATAVQALRTLPAAESTRRDPYDIWRTETEALKTLGAAGTAAVRAVKEEMLRIDRAGEKDDRFKAEAAAVMWSAGGFGEAEAIATLWSTTECSTHFTRVLQTALAAAKTHDERVLPMLVAVLRMRQPADTVMGNTASFPPPEILHAFVWDAYGAKGTPVLARLVEDSNDDAITASAVALLGSRHHLEALPRIRSLAAGGAGAVRAEAVKALGQFGHPQDFEFLAGGLKASPASAEPFVLALARYGDLRAVPLLIPMLSSGDAKVKYAVADALAQLPTAEGLAALSSCAKADGTSALGANCRQELAAALRMAGANAEDFPGMNAAAHKRVAAAARQWTDNLLIRKGGTTFTHEDFVTTARKWIAAGRAAGSPDWIADFASVTTAEDIPLLVDLRGALYGELDHEALGEAEGATILLQLVGRSRYRANPGVCEKVEPK